MMHSSRCLTGCCFTCGWCTLWTTTTRASMPARTRCPTGAASCTPGDPRPLARLPRRKCRTTSTISRPKSARSCSRRPSLRTTRPAGWGERTPRPRWRSLWLQTPRSWRRTSGSVPSRARSSRARSLCASTSLTSMPRKWTKCARRLSTSTTTLWTPSVPSCLSTRPIGVVPQEGEGGDQTATSWGEGPPSTVEGSTRHPPSALAGATAPDSQGQNSALNSPPPPPPEPFLARH
uniref:Putative microtubule-associated protein n=1 Tax=Ixodes scapularis TaxID=6945 RepID=A0A4D5RWQ6_IXOSC